MEESRPYIIHEIIPVKKRYKYKRANERNRTADLLITNQLLYRLSYVGFLPQDIIAHEKNF